MYDSLAQQTPMPHQENYVTNTSDKESKHLTGYSFKKKIAIKLNLQW